MERRIVLTLKNKEYSKIEVVKEMRTIKKMMPYIESFRAFCDNYEVLDVLNRAKVSNFVKLSEMYSDGMNTGVLMYVVNKN